jgi:hypothetical protein
MSSLDQERLARKQRTSHKYDGEAVYYRSEAAESRRPCAVGAAVGCVLDDRLADDPHPDGVHGETCSHKILYDASLIWLSDVDISSLSEWVSHHLSASTVQYRSKSEYPDLLSPNPSPGTHFCSDTVHTPRNTICTGLETANYSPPPGGKNPNGDTPRGPKS